jgi:uncharacterized protein
MDRLESLRRVVDEIVLQQRDKEEVRCAFVHLYGVSAVCVQLALKRGLDPQLCGAAGMLHDIWCYMSGRLDDHARLSALEAGRFLPALGLFTEQETAVICDAISRHSDKSGTHSEMAELLKDADVFQHYIYNPALPSARRTSARLRRVLAELGVPAGDVPAGDASAVDVSAGHVSRELP